MGSMQSGGKGLVLVVDDDPDIREALKYLLEDEGFEVATARDNAEARRTFDEVRPRLSLVTIDGLLPDGPTWEGTIQHFRTKFGGPIVGMSGTNNPDLLAAGATAALPKPVESDAFLKLVETLTT